jgi:hypothetical protein
MKDIFALIALLIAAIILFKCHDKTGMCPESITRMVEGDYLR